MTRSSNLEHEGKVWKEDTDKKNWKFYISLVGSAWRLSQKELNFFFTGKKKTTREEEEKIKNGEEELKTKAEKLWPCKSNGDDDDFQTK